MSISVFQPSPSKVANHAAGMSGRSVPPLRSHPASNQKLAPYVDLQYSAYSGSETQPPANPVADLIPDEVYSLLRSNDMINEKAVRDYIIRRAFRKLREEQNVKTAEAIGMIKEIYPYLQLDTIRKIIYRIAPVS